MFIYHLVVDPLVDDGLFLPPATSCAGALIRAHRAGSPCAESLAS
jgi:hypothetical protein